MRALYKSEHPGTGRREARRVSLPGPGREAPGQRALYYGVMPEALPGADLVRQGIADLARGIESVPALLVAIGAPRLRRAGLDVPADSYASPEHRLYELLAREDPDAAHSRYNALIRRLVSFERAAECGGL